VTLEFRCDPRRPPERTLLEYAHEYELSANGRRPDTYAAANTVRLTAYYAGQDGQEAADGSSRHEALYARGAGDRVSVIGELPPLLPASPPWMPACHRLTKPAIPIGRWRG
jgi:hypothetical protein